MKKKVLGSWFLVLGVLLAFALVACDNGDEKEEEPFTLTVKELPATDTGKLYGVTLMDFPSSPTNIPTTPTAVGGIPVGEVYKLYQPGADGKSPDTKKPFTTAGTYMVMIALTNLSDPTNPEKILIYVTTTGLGSVTYSKSTKNVDLTYSNQSFVTQEQLGQMLQSMSQ